MLTLRKELDLSVAFTTFWTRQVQQLDMKRQAHLLRYQVLQQLLRYDNIFIVCNLNVHLHKTIAKKAAKLIENFFTFSFAHCNAHFWKFKHIDILWYEFVQMSLKNR